MGRYCSTEKMILSLESRSWCGKENEDRKQGKETAIAELLIQKSTPPKTGTVQFVCI